MHGDQGVPEFKPRMSSLIVRSTSYSHGRREARWLAAQEHYVGLCKYEYSSNGKSYPQGTAVATPLRTSSARRTLCDKDFKTKKQFPGAVLQF